MSAAALGTSSRGFGWTLAASVAVHLAIGALVVLIQSRAPRPPRLSEAIPVQLVRLGKPRDPKLLPRKVKPPPRAAKAEPTPIPTKPGKGPGVALDAKTKEKSKPAEPQLSDAARRMLEGSDRALDEALERLEEPEGSPLGVPEGTTTDPQGEVDPYTLEVQRRLKAQYAIPKTIPAAQRPSLEAEVILYINRDGSVHRHEFVSRHPNAQFMSALEALLNRITFPPPPAERAAALFREGMFIGFRP